MAFRRASFQHHFYSFAEPVEEIAESLSKDMDALAFVYPRSVSQQTDKSTLYSKKAYGLVHPKIAILGLPVWGVPKIESQGDFPLEDEVPPYVQEAVEDMWRTAGFGVHVIFPMRERLEDSEAGDAELVAVANRLKAEKPDLWDLTTKERNPLLGNYYSKHIKMLQDFLYGRIRKEKLPAHLLRAYRQGQLARRAETTPPWFSNDPAVFQTYQKPQASSSTEAEAKADDFSDTSSSGGAPGSAVDEEEAQASPSPRSTQSAPAALNSAVFQPEPPFGSAPEEKSPASDRPRAESPRSTSPQVEELPSYQPLYDAQEAARWWKKPLAIVISILTFPTLIIPALTYWIWKRDKEEELVQKFEMTTTQYAALKAFRSSLKAPKLDNNDGAKPRKERVEPASEDPGEDKLITILADREQARRLRFFMDRKATGNWEKLSEPERAFLKQSKEESVKLAPQLGYR